METKKEITLIWRLIGYLWLGIWFILTLIVFFIMGYVAIHFKELMAPSSGELSWLNIMVSIGLGLFVVGGVSFIGYLILSLILSIFGIELKLPEE